MKMNERKRRCALYIIDVMYAADINSVQQAEDKQKQNLTVLLRTWMDFSFTLNAWRWENIGEVVQVCVYMYVVIPVYYGYK